MGALGQKRPTGGADNSATPTGGLFDDFKTQLCFAECDLFDRVGNMDATLVNGATCVEDEGIIFDGDDDYVSLNPAELGGPMTFAVWARRDGEDIYGRVTRWRVR